MSLSTYAELKSAIASWIDRSDLTTAIPDFITLAETDITRWLRVWWNEKRADATPTSAFIALPTDYIGMRNVQWNYSDYRVPLEQLSPEGMDHLEMLSEVGTPQFYCIQDGQIEIRPSPASDNTTKIEISYYFKPTVLSDSNTSNEILVNAADMLLYACLWQGFVYVMDEQRAEYWRAQYEKVKNDVSKSSQKATWGEGNVLRTRVI